jgi:ketosteroid isomerase-like protein
MISRRAQQMKGTDMHPNEELARREMDLINAGDFEALGGVYTDDFVLHYPGRSPLAGSHRDYQEFRAKLDRLFAGGSLKRELHDALGTEDHAVQLVRVTAKVGGRSHSWNAVWVMHVRDGKFSEAWLSVDDQYALDEFLSSLGAGTP